MMGIIQIQEHLQLVVTLYFNNIFKYIKNEVYIYIIVITAFRGNIL